MMHTHHIHIHINIQIHAHTHNLIRFVFAFCSFLFHTAGDFIYMCIITLSHSRFGLSFKNAHSNSNAKFSMTDDFFY